MKWFQKKKGPPLLSPLEGYNLWASSYSEESNPVKMLSDQLIKNLLPDLSEKSVLDCGCGTGNFCSMAEQQNAKKVVGIDLSPAMIAIARQHLTRTELICSDISVTELPEKTFDVCVSALMMAHLPDIEPTLKKMLSAIKPNGIFVLTDFHPFLTLQQARRTFRDQHSGNNYEVKHYLHLFEEYFYILDKENFIIEKFSEPTFEQTPVVFGIKARKQVR